MKPIYGTQLTNNKTGCDLSQEQFHFVRIVIVYLTQLLEVLMCKKAELEKDRKVSATFSMLVMSETNCP